MSDLTLAAEAAPTHPYDFDGLVAVVAQRVAAGLEADVAFKVATTNLQEVFLSGLAGEQQDHTCATCRGFFRRYGGLVSIDPKTGKLTSLAWDESSVPEEYKRAVYLLRQTVESSAVRDVFYHEAGIHGVPQSEAYPNFTHFHFIAEQGRYKQNMVAPLSQHVAKARENFAMLAKSIPAFTMNTLWDAARLFTADTVLASSTKHVLTLDEYIKFREDIQNVTERNARSAVIWHHVATNYDGVVLIKNSVLGEFLSNLQDTGYERAKTAFLRQTQGDVYQRPQTAPKPQAINEAEKRIEELGLGTALERRYADLDDIPTTEWHWLPTEADTATAKTSVFAHLKEANARAAVTTRVNGGTMSFEKFLRQVLPTAENIDLLTSPNHRYAFTGLITAVHPEALPIIAWDKDDGSIPRNPVSAYQYTNGTHPGHWKLGNRTKVIGVTVSPSHWYGQSPAGHQKSWLLMLEKGEDTHNGGVGLFPQILRKELYNVRATLEAYSNRATLANPERSRVGISVSEGAPSIGITLDVTTGNIVTMYNIDRWD